MLAWSACTAGFGQSVGLETYLKNVREARSAGQKEIALRSLDDLLVMAPQAPEVYFERATLRLELNDAAGARADVDRVVALAPKWSAARSWRGRLRLNAGDYEGAIADFGEKGGPETMEMRGQALIAIGHYEAALTEFETLMSGIYGPYTNARYPRALCLLALDRVDEAVDWFEAEMGDRGRVEARIQLVLGYALQGRFDAAEKNLDEWLQTVARPAPADDYDRYGWEQLRDARDWARYLQGAIRFVQNDFAGAGRVLGEVAPESEVSDYARLLRQVVVLRTKKPADVVKSGGGVQNEWPQTLAKLLAGELTEKQVFTAASQEKDAAIRRRMETEAAFYSGEKRLGSGDEMVAKLLFEKVVGFRKADATEYVLAKIALKTL